MVQIAMVITGLVAGLRVPSKTRARAVVVCVFVAVLLVQTPVVALDDGLRTGTDVAIYTAIQVVSLAVGLAMATRIRRRDRRAA